MSQDNFVCVAHGQGARAIEELVAKIDKDLGGRVPKLIAFFASPELDGESLDRAFESKWPGVTRMSSTSGGEFTQERDAHESVVAWALGGDLEVRAGFAKGLGADSAAAIEKVSSQIPKSLDGYPNRVGILLLDPLAGCAEEITLSMAMALEGDSPVRLVGGAAADNFSMSKPRVGINGQAGDDAIGVAMVFSKKPFGIGVGHGHTARSPEFTVTKSVGNIVYEIDGVPAWDLWLEQARAIAAQEGVDLDEPNPGEESLALLTYQFGVVVQGGDVKVRSPFKRLEGGAIQMASALPEGAKIHVTCGSAESQVHSASQAANDARGQLDGAPLAGALVFDCICRKIILRERFFDAVTAASDAVHQVPLAGFETYGEIALKEGDFSGFHNCSTVVLAVPA